MLRFDNGTVDGPVYVNPAHVTHVFNGPGANQIRIEFIGGGNVIVNGAVETVSKKLSSIG